ncbi:MAG: hypothetical protein ACQEWV_19970 [Bacillota bacterium]
MVWKPEEWTAKVLKEYDHLQLMWIRGKGNMVFDKKGIEDITLVKFGEDKDRALKEFDLMVFNHLKEQYKDVI